MTAAAQSMPRATEQAAQRASNSAALWVPWVGVAAFVAAFLVPALFVGWRIVFKETPPFSGGGAAAYVCTLLLVGLILSRPSLIMDDAPDMGGEPSTMRVLCLAIVFVFSAVVLRTAWNTGTIPSLENQGNWVWLITAALGGKALQKFAELKAPAKGAPGDAESGATGQGAKQPPG